MRAIPFALALLLAAVLALGLSRNAPEAAPPSRLVGKIIEQFDIPLLDSAERFTPQRWQGKPVIINMFASWCESCLNEHAVVSRLAKETKIDIYGIAWRDKPEKTKAWLAAHGNPYTLVAYDEQGKTTVPLALTGIPQTMIIDKTGKVVFDHKTPLTDAMLEEQVLPLLKQLSDAR